MRFTKKINIGDPAIQIRILKALDENKPFGLFKHFYMVRILRNLKRPNVITSVDIWNFLEENFDVSRYNEEADREILKMARDFDCIYKS